MSITTIDKEAIRALRVEIAAALQVISEKHGLAIELGNSSYNANSFDMKVNFRLKNAAPKVAEDYFKYQKILGLPDLNTSFTVPGTGTYTIVGFKPQARKNNLLVTDVKGNTLSCPHTLALKYVHIKDLPVTASGLTIKRIR